MMVTGVSRYLKREQPEAEIYEQTTPEEQPEVPRFEEQWKVEKYDPDTLLDVLVAATREGWNVYRILEKDRVVVFDRMREVSDESEQASTEVSSEKAGG